MEKKTSSVLNIAFLLLLAVVSLVLSLYCSEVALRFLATRSKKIALLTQDHTQPQSIEEIFTLDQLRQKNYFFLEPGTNFDGFITNSQGFLTPEVSYVKPKDVYRIVFIGDSFGVGVVPYKKHFIRILEQKLNEQLKLKKKVEIINLSQPGIGMKTYERLLSIEAVKYQPDMVIVDIFVGNDLSTEFYQADGFLFDKPSQESKTFKLLLLVENLYKIFNSYQHLPVVRKDLGKDKPGTLSENYSDEHDDNLPSFTEEKSIEIAKFKIKLLVKDQEIYRMNTPQIREVLQKMAETAKQKNFNLVFMIMPDELQFNNELQQSVMTEVQKDEVIDTEFPQKVFLSLVPKDVEVIDLLPVFKQQDNPVSLYQPRDTHINVKGNELVAGTLFERLSHEIINFASQQ